MPGQPGHIDCIERIIARECWSGRLVDRVMGYRSDPKPRRVIGVCETCSQKSTGAIGVCLPKLTNSAGRFWFASFSPQTRSGRSQFAKSSRQNSSGAIGVCGSWPLPRRGDYSLAKSRGKGAALLFCDLRWGGVLLVCFHLSAGECLLRAILGGAVWGDVELCDRPIALVSPCPPRRNKHSN